MGMLRVNEEWARASLRTLPMGGVRGPAAFISALSSAYDNGAWANYVSWRLRFPEGPYLNVILGRLNAARFPAANDPDRLYRIGNTFQLKQYEFEIAANFELRCGTAWDLHGWGGTSIGVRKGLEAYGFPQIEILEEWQHGIRPTGCEYTWAETIVLGPNYGDLPIDPMVLGEWVLGLDALATGTFNSNHIDDVVRVILEWRQVHDSPWRIVFIFGNPWVLGLSELDGAPMGPSAGNGYAVREVRNRCALNTWVLGSTNFLGFGV